MGFVLDVFGLHVSVDGGWPEVVDAVRLDYIWFESNTAQTPTVQVEVHRGPPDFASFGDVPASFVTPRNVVYQSGSRTIVDYFGRALSVLDRETGKLRIEGEDAEIVHEAAYMFLLSRIGEHLDAQHLTRLHGLGLAGRSGAVVVMLPSGGGKSTLALRALRESTVSLLSDDSPVIDRRGRTFPFPLRIGVNATDAATLPKENVRRIERMEFHPKLALELSAFADRIESSPQPLAHLVIGRRSLGGDASLVPLPGRAAIGALLREAVVGVGIYQGMEFVLQRGMRDVVGKAGVAAMRARCCAAALRRAQVWSLTLGRDHDANWDALKTLLL